MVKHTRKDIHNCISKGFYQQIITKKDKAVYDWTERTGQIQSSRDVFGSRQ